MAKDVEMFAAKASHSMFIKTLYGTSALIVFGLIVGARLLVAPNDDSVIRANIKAWAKWSLAGTIVLLGVIAVLMNFVVKDVTEVVEKVDGELVNALAVQVIFGVFQNFANLQVVDRTIHQWQFSVKNPTPDDLTLQTFSMDMKLESTTVCDSKLGTQTILPPEANSQVYFLTQFKEERWLYIAGGQVALKATLMAVADVAIGISMNAVVVGQEIQIYAPVTIPIDMSHFPALAVQNADLSTALQDLSDITKLKNSITSGLERNHEKDVTMVEWESSKMEGGLFTKVYILLGLLAVCVTPIISLLVVAIGLMYETSTKGRIDDRSYITDVMLAQEQRDAAAAAGGATDASAEAKAALAASLRPLAAPASSSPLSPEL
jgi:hypothetical protein